MVNSQRIVGVVLLLIGLVLVVVGFNATDSVADRWSNFFTGQYTDTTVWYLVGGGAAGIIGLTLLATGRRVI